MGPPGPSKAVTISPPTGQVVHIAGLAFYFGTNSAAGPQCEDVTVNSECAGHNAIAL